MSYHMAINSTGENNKFKLINRVTTNKYVKKILKNAMVPTMHHVVS